MGSERKRFSADFKAKVALEALRGDRTISQIASTYKVHPNQVGQWRNQLLKDSARIFAGVQKRQQDDHQQLIDALYQQIGQLTVELEWLKKR